MKLATGTVFAGDYEVLRELSEGGMGAVYVVLQRSTGKQRALKLMHPQLVADPVLRKRFDQEARVAAMIESDHVVEVVGAGVDDASGSPWLAMELLKGQELGAIAPAPLATTHVVLRELCHAVGAAHRARIVHRDLKPENVFLADSKRADGTRAVKVLDFGIAKIAAEASTQHTAAMGSPIWMAPEQTEKGAIGPPADVWAIGLIVYHLLTGHFFWPAADDPTGTIHQVMREILFEPIPAVTTRAAEQGVAHLVPPWFDPWFARCVVRDPAQRFPDADAAFAAFEAAAGGRVTSFVPPLPLPSHQSMPVQAPASASAPIATQLAISTPGYEPPRRSRVPLFFFAGILAVVGGGALYASKLRRTTLPPVVAASAPASEVPAPQEVPAPVATLTQDAPATSGSAHANPKRKQPSHASSAFSAALAEAASSTPTPMSVSEAPFDRAAALAAIEAVNLDPCSILQGVHGPGKVFVIFMNTGVPARAYHEPGPYPNTQTAQCINSRLMQTRVAPFSGPMQTVGRKFNLR